MISLSLFARCNRTSDLKVEISTCPKHLTFINTDFIDTNFTSINIHHQGFCYNSIDSVILVKDFILGDKSTYLTDTLKVAMENIVFNESSNESCLFSIKLIELSDTSESIAGKLTAIYQNRTESNTIAFSYQLPCKKHIDTVATELIDTMSCETASGTGDRHLISFEHQGYCTQEIDSIAGYGDFYSNDGFFWNSSYFLVPRERITFQENNTFLQKISFKLCITNHYSDYVNTKFYLVYKDGSKSNVAFFKILFDYQNEKSLPEKNCKAEMK